MLNVRDGHILHVAPYEFLGFSLATKPLLQPSLLAGNIADQAGPIPQ